MNDSQIIIYQTEDGQTKLDARLENDTVWLSQKMMIELFQTTKQNISLHIKNCFKEGELEENRTVKKYLTVQKEGNRNIEREIDFYNLDVIISVGYRVKSMRGTQFRIWANRILKEHIVKGYTINEKRLKERNDKISLDTDHYERRLIVYIDLIGFKNFVSPNNGNGKEKSVKALTSYFQKKVSEGYKYKGENAFAFIPAFNFFSDTIIISYPLENVEKYKNIALYKHLLLCLVCCGISDIQLHALKYGLLSRGCVTIGDIYHNKNTWFGPGIIEAHEYESQIANYPRVILSKNCYEYFKNEIKNISLIQDSDSYFYVSYIERIHPKLDENFCKTYHKLREIIINNMNDLKKDPRKYKELQKWQWLASYFNKYSNEKLRPNHGKKLSGEIEIW